MDKLTEIFSKLPNVDARSVQFLTDALNKNNLPGFDYLEFKQSLAALESLNIDERTAFYSAFATASTMGLTKGKLLESATFYKKILANEHSKFEEALRQQTALQIASKQKEITDTHALIDQKRAEIQRLQEQIDRHYIGMEEAQKQIEVAKERIFTAKENFETTFQVIDIELNSDIEKIKTILV